jgi:phage terminase large subunit-like protein
VKAIYFAITNDRVTILITSPSLRQSMIMFSRISSFIFNTPIRNSVVRATRTIIQFDNQSEIIALPASENLLRGYTAHMIICDEASFMPEEMITNVIFPMISTTHGYAIFLSTPWGRDHFFYRAFMDPNYSVHRVKSSECPLIKPEFLEEMRRNMTEQAFRMEYEAEFVEASTSYFSQSLIRSCVNPEIEFISSIDRHIPSGEYYGGCDLGKLQDYSVFVVAQKINNKIQLVFLKEFPLETPYSHVIGFMVRANEKFRFRRILVDKSGVGEVVTEEIKSQGLMNTEGQSFTAQSKAEMLAFLKIKMEQGLFKMPYDRRLCGQINEQRFEYMKSGQLKFWHPLGSHDDQLWALALACFAAKETEATGALVRAY